ncbi:MAG: PEP-CTERM sorting domain-containing protein [Akkermansiaceae bacterium]
MNKKVLIVGLSLLAGHHHAHAVLTLQSFSADKHHRFDNDPAFIGNPHDWSGVARANTSGRWVTMISSTHFITSNHAAPGIGNTVIFHEDNDPSGTTVSRTVTSRTRIGGTDLVIGQLNATPGPTIAIYSIASNTTNEASFTSSPWNNREAFVVGLNNTGSGTTQFRVGRNELDGFGDDVEVTAIATVSGSLTGIGDAIAFDDDRGTGDSLGSDEAYLQGGDSGGPLFSIADSGEFTLTGINWFITTEESPNLSGATFLPNYISEIQSILDAEGGGETLSLVSIPEPSSLALLSVSGLLLVRRRR